MLTSQAVHGDVVGPLVWGEKCGHTMVEQAIDRAMTDQGEISGVDTYVDPKQDVLGTGILRVDINVVPTSTNRAIKVRLGLVNPAARP